MYSPSHCSYTLVGGGSSNFYRYTISSDTWTQRADLPDGAGAGSALAFARWREPPHDTGADGNLYAFRGDDSQDFYRYDPAANGWETLASLPGIIQSGAGAALAWDGGEWVYAVVGGNGKQFLRYHIGTDYWEKLGDGSSATTGDNDVPDKVNAGGGLARIEDALYVVPGDGVARMSRYGPVGGYPEKLTLDRALFVAPEWLNRATWLSTEDEEPFNLRRQPDDFRVASEAKRFVGGEGTVWSPVWSTCTLYESVDVPTIHTDYGSSWSELDVSDGNKINDMNVRDLRGHHDQLSELEFKLYSPLGTNIMFWKPVSCTTPYVENYHLSLDDEVADLAPCPPDDGGTYNPDLPDPPLFEFGGENGAGTWTLIVNDVQPGNGGSVAGWGLEICTYVASEEVTHEEAAFLDPDNHVYRLGASSVLTVGYHTYRPDAIVAPSGEEFASIQVAIGSGANRVLVQPGVYAEPFYLVSGIEVVGAGADQTIVEPAGSATELARAEGVVGASLSRVTLNGNDSGVALWDFAG